MLRHVILFASFIAFCCSALAQPADFTAGYTKLIEKLQSEDWKSAELESKKLLSVCDTVDSMQYQAAVVRYIYIYSTAGLLNEQKLTQKEALAHVKNLQGKVLIMPAHLFNENCYVNCTHISDSDKNTFFTSVNNKKGTEILSFEYVKIRDGIKESAKDLEGKLITTMGVLDKISVEGHMLPRFRLEVVDGDYQAEQE